MFFWSVFLKTQWKKSYYPPKTTKMVGFPRHKPCHWYIPLESMGKEKRAPYYSMHGIVSGAHYDACYLGEVQSSQDPQDQEGDACYLGEGLGPWCYLGEGQSSQNPQDQEGDSEADDKELEDGLGDEKAQHSENLV